MACFSAITTGSTWNYTDCCGIPQSGFNAGTPICVDTSYSYDGIEVSASSCLVECNQLDATISVTGVCENALNGVVNIQPFNGVGPYSIINVVPNIPSLSGASSYGPFNFTGLSGGTYVWLLNDTTLPNNQEIFVNVIVSDCFCGEINDVQGTTCGDDNGSFTVSGSSTSAPYTIELYSGGTLYSGVEATFFPYQFNGLPSGIYHAYISDSGGATAQTESVVVSATTALDYGFWVVDSSYCTPASGKLSVTGLTGVGPYTYLWNNGETGNTITGLTQGTYTVTVTDSYNCTTTKVQNIVQTPQLGLGSLSAVTPSCFTSNGSLTFVITGGTSPFYYSGSTGQNEYSASRTFKLTGLTSGNYFLTVTDKDLCKTTIPGYLTTPGGFDIVTLSSTNSTCSANNGRIDIEISGTLSNNYIYGITGQTNGFSQNVTTTSQSHSFTNLSNDTYNISISGTGSSCLYQTTKTISSSDKFTVTTALTGSTCGLSNGAIGVTVGSGYTGLLDYVLSSGDQIIDTSLTAFTFTNLSSGSYTLTVTDEENCSITKNLTISSSGNLTFSVFGTDCVNGNDGTAEVIITNGTPPFTYSWSNGETGSTINNLSGDTYFVTVSASTGCTLRKQVTITCGNSNVSSYTTVGVCNQLFDTISGTKRSMKKMLNEGFLDVTSGRTNCILNTAEFNAVVSITGSTGWVSGSTVPFYTATTLNSVPTDSDWVDTVRTALLDIPEVGSVDIDLINNTIIIKSDCDGDTDPLKGAVVKIQLQIVYDVNCVT